MLYLFIVGAWFLGGTNEGREGRKGGEKKKEVREPTTKKKKQQKTRK
jgi:hypothetical protein